MLDTNICIYLIRKQSASVLKRLTSKSPEEVCISSVTLSELEYGVAKSSQKKKNQEALLRFVLPIQVVSFDAQAARVYGTVRASLERKGTPIGSLDTLIAAHALSVDAVLVTNNTREFERVENLNIEDWTS